MIQYIDIGMLGAFVYVLIMFLCSLTTRVIREDEYGTDAYWRGLLPLLIYFAIRMFVIIIIGIIYQ